MQCKRRCLTRIYHEENCNIWKPNHLRITDSNLESILMHTTLDHYKALLADIYTWMAGGPTVALESSRALFKQCGITGHPRGVAVDLGCGPGFQSLTLAELSYEVLAVDNCPAFLESLRKAAPDSRITTVCDDLLNFRRHMSSPAQLAICLGDTLTHLSSLDEVSQLLSEAHAALADNGILILTLRDYGNEPAGTRRFIPARSDDTRILTCCLQFFESDLEVTDLLYNREPSGWAMNVSSYRKIKISIPWLVQELESRGFRARRDDLKSGMVCIVAQKIR